MSWNSGTTITDSKIKVIRMKKNSNKKKAMVIAIGGRKSLQSPIFEALLVFRLIVVFFFLLILQFDKFLKIFK